ncbi:Alpha/Beta hydrolase protein [Helicostylum pulchrum]|nr:Alpha/Beta hydrolase protein [Helicostylum pulchrum]
MDFFRKLIRSFIPPSISIFVIQTILSLPPKLSRYLIASFTAPTKPQMKWVTLIEKDTWKGAWIGPSMSECTARPAELSKRIKKADLIIYKVHGGAFRVGHSLMYMDVFIDWIELLKKKYNINALILSVEYSLAPESQYPVPVLECVGAYKYLVKTLKVPGSKIILSGDSAGGALCLETLIRIYAPDMLTDILSPRTNFSIELPAGLLLVSPLVSADTNSWLWEFKKDIITPVLAKNVLKEYLNLPEADPTNLHLLKLTRITSGFNRFAPKNVLCYVGEREVMRDVILKLTDCARCDGNTLVEVRQENFEHNWYFVRELVARHQHHVLQQCDEQFVDFAANCLNQESDNLVKVVETLQVKDPLNLSSLKSRAHKVVKSVQVIS